MHGIDDLSPKETLGSPALDLCNESQSCGGRAMAANLSAKHQEIERGNVPRLMKRRDSCMNNDTVDTLMDQQALINEAIRKGVQHKRTCIHSVATPLRNAINDISNIWNSSRILGRTIGPLCVLSSIALIIWVYFLARYVRW